MRRRRRWLWFLPAVLILLSAVAARFLVADGDSTTTVAAPPASSSTTTVMTVATTSTTVEEAPHQAEDDAAPLELDLTTVDRQDPKAVAAAWGCAYWAHPVGETPEALAKRLSPLATAELTAAVEPLRIPDYGADVVEVYPGTTERTTKPNTYSVGCHTVTIGPDGAPLGPPSPVLPEVTVTFEAGGWVVSAATVGGLVLP